MALHKQSADRSVPIWLARIRLELRRLAQPVLEKKQNGLFSITLQAPLAHSTLLPETNAGRHFWYRPAEKLKLIGLGCARELVAEGESRFQVLHQAYARLQDDWTHVVHGSVSPRGRAFLGYAFDPVQREWPLWQGYPNSRLTVPALLAEWRGDSCNLTFSSWQDERNRPDKVLGDWMQLLDLLASQQNEAEVGTAARVLSSEASTTRMRWLEQVRQIKTDIGAGKISKVVLGRHLRLNAEGDLNLNALLSELATTFPSCAILATDAGSSTLVAASPERLVSVSAGNLQSDALAGTLESSNNSPSIEMRDHEHAPVVSAIRSALQPLCTELKAAEHPGSMQLGTMQHLWTRVTGRLKKQATLFDLVARLHPTPAVGGVPRQAAMKWIEANDPTPRGWYTGGYGWLGDGVNGDISVLLRCALLQANRADLFAGAGITEVSDPPRELEETDWKFSAILDALRNTHRR